MACLKCGRESDQTFCEECRAVMARYPVKPNAIAVIPKNRQSAQNARRSSNRRAPISADVMIENQNKLIRGLAITVLCMVLIIFAMGYAGYRLIRRSNARPVGQNYSTVIRTAPDAAATETTGGE